MNHEIDELEDCVYDYLAANPDKYHLTQEIFYDITTKTTGHRCEGLTSSTDHKLYFTWICHHLKFFYEGVRFYYDGEGGTYLAFVTDDGNNILLPDVNGDINGDDYDAIWQVTYSSEFGYFFKNKLYERYSAEDFAKTFYSEPMIFEMCRHHKKHDDIIRLIRDKHIDISLKNNHNQTLLDVAIENKNTDLVIKLVHLMDSLAMKSVLSTNSAMELTRHKLAHNSSGKSKGCCEAFTESLCHKVQLVSYVSLIYFTGYYGYYLWGLF